jgi:NAD(P)-dependent dehydrogenase (short-subunit alcohol dehydrogenase family)
MQHEITEMLNKAKVVNCSSVAGLVGFKDCLHTSPQAWRNRINKNSCIGICRTGNRVNAVCPGVIQTP